MMPSAETKVTAMTRRMRAVFSVTRSGLLSLLLVLTGMCLAELLPRVGVTEKVSPWQMLAWLICLLGIALGCFTEIIEVHQLRDNSSCNQHEIIFGMLAALPGSILALLVFVSW